MADKLTAYSYIGRGPFISVEITGGILRGTHGLRVMSFNVRGSFRDASRKNAWGHRAALNVATIKRWAPEVIGLQESQRGNLATYRRHLPRYTQIRGPGYGNAFPYDSNAILYDPERLRPLDTGGFWLSETPEKHSKSWGTRVARSATWALFAPTNANHAILHLNTHLDHVSATPTLVLTRDTTKVTLIGAVSYQQLESTMATLHRHRAPNTNAIVKTCLSTGRLTGRYTRAQLRAALRSMPASVKEYSNCQDVIRHALRNAR